jgi:hypothetical protein
MSNIFAAAALAGSACVRVARFVVFLAARVLTAALRVFLVAMIAFLLVNVER